METKPKGTNQAIWTVVVYADASAARKKEKSLHGRREPVPLNIAVLRRIDAPPKPEAGQKRS